jgi:ketosteroid isomerase-like protein
MEDASDVTQSWRHFCDRLTAGDVDSFDALVSREATVIIGTAPDEWIDDRARMRFGFETEGVGLTPVDPLAWAEGSLGFVVDRPRFTFPDGSGMDTRVTAVLRLEDEAWRLVHAHFSVGVPDEEVALLQARWAG